MSNQHTPAYADWLDDRYVLFIEQLASGSFTVGGDLCVSRHPRPTLTAG